MTEQHISGPEIPPDQHMVVLGSEAAGDFIVLDVVDDTGDRHTIARRREPVITDALFDTMISIPQAQGAE